MTMRRSKYGNVRTEVNGIKFDSKKEARRYQELLLMQAAGEIERLLVKTRYPLIVRDVKICEYEDDFSYVDRKNPTVFTVEDCKGAKTPVYRLKKKLFDVLYGGSHKLIET